MPELAAASLFVLLGCTACSARGPDSGAHDALGFVAAPGAPYEIGAGVGRPVLADLNADSALDIVVPYEAEPGTEGDAGRVAVLLGDGSGRFRIQPSPATAPLGGLKLAVGDVDEDGYPDVVAASHDSYAVRLLRGDGRGGLRAAGRDVPARAGDRPHTHSIALADVDGDGHLDLVTGNADDGEVAVLRGDGKGGFRPVAGSPFAAGSHPYEGLIVRDLDGDGDLDIAVPDLLGAALAVLLGDGRGGFVLAPGSPHRVAPRPGSVGAGDVDGDGRVDLVATHDDDPLVSVLRGTEAGFVTLRGSPFRLEQRAWDVRIVDLDGDGRNECILGGTGTDVFVRFAGPGDEFPMRVVRVSDVGPGPGYLALGDLDHDGLLDLVTGNFSGRSVSVLLARR